MSGMCGGLGAAENATPEVQDICDKLKDKIEAHTNNKYSTIEAITYSSQVVAGTNFFIKVHTGNEEYIHIRVFRPLPPNMDNLEISAVQTGKTKDEVISYFQS